jgi:hypothetical protein
MFFFILHALECGLALQLEVCKKRIWNPSLLYVNFGDHQSNLNVKMSVALGIENPKCIGTGCSFL